MYEHIPQLLKKQKHWVCWQAIPDDSREGKIKKVPVNPRTGEMAQSNNPETWTDFKTACQAAEAFSGIGFMFGRGFVGIDIDDAQECIEDYRNGLDDNMISEFIHTLQSYTEYSVSGEGIHIICRGKLPPYGRRRGNVEMYSEGRFFVVTGNIAAEYTEIADCTEKLQYLHEKYIGGGKAPTTGILPQPAQISLSAEEVIERAKASKQGRIFSDLYAGDWAQYFRSQSEADMSFCNMLAFWCRKDEQMMDDIFRASGLMRPKWERKQSGSTYGKLTIQKAIRTCTSVYEPKAQYSISFGVKKQPPKLYTFDDTGNAEKLVDIFGESIRYSYVNKAWMYYDGRRWCTDMSGEMKRMADETIEEMRGHLQDYIEAAEDVDDMEKQFSRHMKYCRSSRAKIAMLKESEHRVPISPAEMDANKYLFCTTNGVVALKNGSLGPHKREYFITKLSGVEYTDKIDAPRWTAFLEDIFGGDQELIRYIQKAVGYSLTGDISEQCAFFCYGTGRNGKSTFLDMITEIMGDYAVNIQPETLMVRPNTGGPTSDIARLKGARFVTTVEPNEGARLNEGLLKQLTGGDRVTASKKYENEFEFIPEFKLWMGTNHKPYIRGTDIGIWRRIHLIPFTVQVPENRVDKRLKYKLRKELTGILKWAVDGCLLWQKEGLEKPRAVQEASKEYRGEMDVLSSFIEDCVVVGAGEVKATDLFSVYSNWAREGNEYEMSSTKFGREMAKRFEKVKKGGYVYYCGLHILPEIKPYYIKIVK